MMSDLNILHLPTDVLVNILQKLSLSDLRNVMLTCKLLREIVLENNSIWRQLTQNKLILHNCTNNRQTAPVSCYHQTRISQNWCKGIYRGKVVIYHNTNYMPWLRFHNSEALVLTVGSQLRCYPTDKRGFPDCKDLAWKLEVPKVKRHDVRTNDISRFIIRNDLLVCGNRDGCVAIYKMNNTKHRPTLLTHIVDCHESGQVEVSAVETVKNAGASQGVLVTGSMASKQLLFWNPWDERQSSNGYSNSVKAGRIVNETIISECTGVRCLATNNSGEMLAIGLNGNSKPILLDVNTGERLLTATGTMCVQQAVRDVGWHNESTVMFVTHFGKLQLVDIRTGSVVFDAMDPIQCSLYCVKSDAHNALVVGSSEYSRCVLFDSRNSTRHVQMYFTQKKSSPVYSLDFDSSKLIAAADRGVAVLNFNINASAARLRDYSYTFEIV